MLLEDQKFKICWCSGWTRCKKGVFITTARFTNEAKEYQPKNETKIVLIDGEQLAELMIDYDLAVSITNKYIIKRIDNDYFEEVN